MMWTRTFDGWKRAGRIVNPGETGQRRITRHGGVSYIVFTFAQTRSKDARISAWPMLDRQRLPSDRFRGPWKFMNIDELSRSYYAEPTRISR